MSQGSEKLQYALSSFPDNFETKFKQKLKQETIYDFLKDLLRIKQIQMMKETFETMSPNDIQCAMKLISEHKIEGLEYHTPTYFDVPKTALGATVHDGKSKHNNKAKK